MLGNTAQRRDFSYFKESAVEHERPACCSVRMRIADFLDHRGLDERRGARLAARSSRRCSCSSTREAKRIATVKQTCENESTKEETITRTDLWTKVDNIENDDFWSGTSRGMHERTRPSPSDGGVDIGDDRYRSRLFDASWFERTASSSSQKPPVLR